MINIKLNGKYGSGKFAVISSDDRQLTKYKWYVSSLGYVVRFEKYKIIPIVCEIIKIKPKKMVIDHKNGNKLDNRRGNLRICTYPENCINSPMKKNNTSGYKGVTFWKRDNNWKAQIRFNRKNLHIGYFQTKEKAAKAYNKKARELFGNFAYLNKLTIK